MKKPNRELIELQVKKDIKARTKPSSNKNIKYSYVNYTFPEFLDIQNKLYRTLTMRAVNSLKDHKNTSNRPFFDFSKVKILSPMAMIHFKQVLEKNDKIICRGKPSSNSVISGMLSKLKISKRLGMSEAHSTHNLVEKWYFFSGENTDLGDEYDEIEDVLKEKFGEDSETFDVINTAIGEAVINVVNHAYKEDDRYKKWYLFLSITNDNCNVIISDLGQTIPNSIPTKISDNILERVFKFKTWGEIGDDSKIEIATQYQKTATKLSHRGKGFQDMKAVCDQLRGSTMMIHSKGGYWARKNDEKERFKKQNYKTDVNGTIISWQLPLNNSTIKVDDSALLVNERS